MAERGGRLPDRRRTASRCAEGTCTCATAPRAPPAPATTRRPHSQQCQGAGWNISSAPGRCHSCQCRTETTSSLSMHTSDADSDNQARTGLRTPVLRPCAQSGEGHALTTTCFFLASPSDSAVATLDPGWITLNCRTSLAVGCTERRKEGFQHPTVRISRISLTPVYAHAELHSHLYGVPDLIPCLGMAHNSGWRPEHVCKWSAHTRALVLAQPAVLAHRCALQLGGVEGC